MALLSSGDDGFVQNVPASSSAQIRSDKVSSIFNPFFPLAPHQPSRAWGALLNNLWLGYLYTQKRVIPSRPVYKISDGDVPETQGMAASPSHTTQRISTVYLRKSGIKEGSGIHHNED